MKISEVLLNLDLSKQEKYYIGGDFLAEFDEDEYSINESIIESRFTCIWITCWYCTDQFVGWHIILLDGNSICFSSQQGRKCDIKFFWVNDESFKTTKEVVLSAKIPKENKIRLLTLDEDIGDSYKISFNSQIMSHHNVANYNGQKVSVKPVKSNSYIEQEIEITFENGEVQIVNISDVDFSYLGIK